MNTQNTRRGNTQEVAHKTKNNTYRLGVSPTGVASKNENVQCNARKLSGSHPTYKGYSARSVTPQGRYAGYSGRIGFTLIELLVVVLIIGILAAVALPQYQKAIRKSHGVEVLTAAKALNQAVSDYYLEHGTYQGMTAETLNVQIPTLKHAKYRLSQGRSFDFIGFGLTDYLAWMSIYFDNTDIYLDLAWEEGRLVATTCRSNNMVDGSPVEWCADYFPCKEFQYGCDGSVKISCTFPL